MNSLSEERYFLTLSHKIMKRNVASGSNSSSYCTENNKSPDIWLFNWLISAGSLIIFHDTSNNRESWNSNTATVLCISIEPM